MKVHFDCERVFVSLFLFCFLSLPCLLLIKSSLTSILWALIIVRWFIAGAIGRCSVFFVLISIAIVSIDWMNGITRVLVLSNIIQWLIPISLHIIRNSHLFIIIIDVIWRTYHLCFYGSGCFIWDWNNLRHSLSRWISWISRLRIWGTR